MTIPRSAAFRCALLGLAVLLGAAGVASASELNLIIGQKMTDLNDDFETDEIDIEDQPEYGLALTWGKVDWPVMIAIDVLQASEDDSASYYYYGYDYDINLEVESREVHVGVRKFFGAAEGAVPQFYFGGGAAWIDVDADADFDITFIGKGAPVPRGGLEDSFTIEDDDSAVGYWANVGVVWRLGRRFNLGIDGRYSDADVELDEFFDDGEEIDGGGLHVGALLGFRWGD